MGLWRKAFLIGLGGLAVAALGWFTLLYGVTTWQMQRTYQPVDRAFKAAATADPAEGARLARIRGCYGGCHGREAEGHDFFGLPAPNLPALIKDYDDNQLEQVIRQGIRPDGTSVWGMASDMFQYLSDEDLGHIIAFLRALPDSGHFAGPRHPSYAMRRDMLKGWAYPAVTYIRDAAPPVSATGMSPEARGRYLAYSSCPECHGASLEGDGYSTPNLMVASSYDRAAFGALMQRGEAVDGRDIGLMGIMGRSRFSHFTEAEIDALHAFFQSETFQEEALMAAEAAEKVN